MRTPGSVELAQCLSHALFTGCWDSDRGIPDGRHAVQSPLTQLWNDIQEIWPFVGTSLWPPEKILQSAAGTESGPRSHLR